MKEDKAYHKSQLMEQLKADLRVLRGRNLFRGREEYYLDQGLIVLAVEARGEMTAGGEVRIYFTEKESEMRGEKLPGGPTFALTEFGMDTLAFMERAAQLARGEDYLRTNPKNADYRKNL